MLKYKLSEHKDEIITHIIKCTIWLPLASLLALIGTIIKTIVNTYVNSEYSDNNNIIILGSIACIISIISVVFNVIYINNKKKYNSEQQVVEKSYCVAPISNFRLNSVVCELFFQDRINILSSLHYEMTANEDNVECFEKELTWSGKKYYGTQLKNPNGNYTLELFDSNDSMHKYRINFVDPIKCQDKVSFDLETKVSDDDLSMLPISAYMVKHQIDELIIRVVVPCNCIKNVKRSVYLDMYRQMQIGKSSPVRKKIIAGKECYEITIPNPTISHRYFLEWEFTN